MTVTLPKHLEILVKMKAPGIVTVLIDGKPVFDCASYGWGMGVRQRHPSSRHGTSWPV